MQAFNESKESYEQLISGNTEPDAELLTNLYAVLISAGKPELVLAEHNKLDDGYEGCYEVLFNKSCAEIATGDWHSAAESLEASRELCLASLTADGSSEEDIERETAAILLQTSFLHIKSGKLKGSLESCKSILRKYRSELELAAVAANNLAVLRGDKDLPDSLKRFRTAISAAAEEKLTANQLQEIRFNRCVLLLYTRKLEECTRTLDELDKL